MANLVAWNSLGLRAKLLIAFLLVGLTPFVINAYLAMTASSEALEQQAFAQLEGLREVKKNQLNKYIKDRRNDAIVLSSTVETIWHEAFNKLEAVQGLQRTQLEQYFEDRLKLMDDVKQNLRYTGGLSQFGSRLHHRS